MENYIKIKIRERKWYLVALTIFWMYVIVVLQCFNITNTAYEKSNNVNSADTYWEQPLLAGDIVEQELEVNEDGLKKIGITFGTSGRENSSSLHIIFREKEKDLVLYDQIISQCHLVKLKLT